MSDHTISLAFSVLHHYLKLFAEKQEPHLPLPSSLFSSPIQTG